MELSQCSKDIARQYLRINGIVDAFIWKDGPKVWNVYLGVSADSCGWKEAGPFSTKRVASAKCAEINALIEKLKNEEVAPCQSTLNK